MVFFWFFVVVFVFSWVFVCFRVVWSRGADSVGGVGVVIVGCSCVVVCWSVGFFELLVVRGSSGMTTGGQS